MYTIRLAFYSLICLLGFCAAKVQGDPTAPSGAVLVMGIMIGAALILTPAAEEFAALRNKK